MYRELALLLIVVAQSGMCGLGDPELENVESTHSSVSNVSEHKESASSSSQSCSPCSSGSDGEIFLEETSSNEEGGGKDVREKPLSSPPFSPVGEDEEYLSTNGGEGSSSGRPAPLVRTQTFRKGDFPGIVANYPPESTQHSLVVADLFHMSNLYNLYFPQTAMIHPYDMDKAVDFENLVKWTMHPIIFMNLEGKAPEWLRLRINSILEDIPYRTHITVQPMFWKNPKNMLFRPNYYLHPDAPYEGNYDKKTSYTVQIFDPENRIQMQVSGKGACTEGPIQNVIAWTHKYNQSCVCVSPKPDRGSIHIQNIDSGAVFYSLITPSKPGDFTPLLTLNALWPVSSVEKFHNIMVVYHNGKDLPEKGIFQFIQDLEANLRYSEEESIALQTSGEIRSLLSS